jgi:hypothetical protein
MPQGTCILPEIFEFEGPDAANGTSTRALSAVYVVDPAFVLPSVPDGERADETGYLRPFVNPLDDTERLHYEAGVPGQPNSVTPITVSLKLPAATPADIHAFPAHRFAPSGEIIPLQSVQRFRVRVGMLPTSQPDERFVTYEDDVEYDPGPDPSDTEDLNVLFHKTGAPGTSEIVPRFHDPRRLPAAGDEKFELRAFLENSVTLNIYTATGRVEIVPTVELEELGNT